MNHSDIIIIGAGPGGYELAAEAAAEGRHVTLIERDELGGTCLNRGCIPTKALCHAADVALSLREAADEFGANGADGIRIDYSRAAERKDSIVAQLREGIALQLNRVEIVRGTARFTGPATVAVGDEEYTAGQIVIATGSQPARLNVPGAEYAVTSDYLLSLTELPQHIAIIGGGVIGLEFASIFSAFGSDVTVIEFCKEILPPFDKDIARRLRTAMSRRGVSFAVSAEVVELRPGCVVYSQRGKTIELNADIIASAVGRCPVIPEGAEAAGIEVGRRGIVVDDRMQTSVAGVYAVGDVNGRCMLAHAATAQALSAILGHKVNTGIIPAAVFTAPECAMVGLTEEQCHDRQLDFKAVKTMFRSNGKAVAMGETDGLLKLLVDTSTRKILGCHICGPHAADLIQEVSTVMSADLTVDTIASAVHGHPTLSEVLQTAARQI